MENGSFPSMLHRPTDQICFVFGEVLPVVTTVGKQYFGHNNFHVITCLKWKKSRYCPMWATDAPQDDNFKNW